MAAWRPLSKDRQAGRCRAHFLAYHSSGLSFAHSEIRAGEFRDRKSKMPKVKIMYSVYGEMSSQHFRDKLAPQNCLQWLRQMIRKDSSSGIPISLKIVQIVPYNQVRGKSYIETGFLWLWISSMELSHTLGRMACPRAGNLGICFEVENWTSTVSDIY